MVVRHGLSPAEFLDWWPKLQAIRSVSGSMRKIVKSISCVLLYGTDTTGVDVEGLEMYRLLHCRLLDRFGQCGMRVACACNVLC